MAKESTAAIRAGARDFSVEAVAFILGVLQDDESPRDERLQLANRILEYGYGMPPDDPDFSMQEYFQFVEWKKQKRREQMAEILARIDADTDTEKRSTLEQSR